MRSEKLNKGFEELIKWDKMVAYRDEKKKPYSQTYLKTLHNQLSAIFNHAVRYYEISYRNES